MNSGCTDEDGSNIGCRIVAISSLRPLAFFKAVLKEEVDHVGIWREMERLVDEGKLKSIGVSNFNSEQIERLNGAARIPIAVNQVECSPYFQQRKLRAAMDKLGIRMMAYASLGSTGRRKYSSTLRTGKNPVVHNLLEDPTVLSVAERRSKTPAQIILRYLVQLGMVVIPKSSKRDRIVENFSIFDFVLDPEDMAALGGLDKVNIQNSGTGYFRTSA